MILDAEFRALTNQRCGEVTLRGFVHLVAETQDVSTEQLIDAMDSEMFDPNELVDVFGLSPCDAYEAAGLIRNHGHSVLSPNPQMKSDAEEARYPLIIRRSH